MFEVYRSIKRFREDPAWEYQRRSHAEWARFDRSGYPFSLLAGDGRARDLLRGTVAGYPVVLAHMFLPPSGTNRGGRLYPFSLVVLELPFMYPATAVTPHGLAVKWGIEWHAPYSSDAGPAVPLPGGDPAVHRVSAIPEFGMAVTSDAVLRLTSETGWGWRLADRHLIGWTQDRYTYEYMITMAERLARIVAAFPPEAQRWAVPVG